MPAVQRPRPTRLWADVPPSPVDHFSARDMTVRRCESHADLFESV